MTFGVTLHDSRGEVLTPERSETCHILLCVKHLNNIYSKDIDTKLKLNGSFEGVDLSIL